MSIERQPFHFYSEAHMAELTGLKARTLSELRDILRNVPDGVIYYHTHHVLQERLFLREIPPNDFAYWAGAALFDNELSEKLAAINILDFSNLSSLRERFVTIIDEHLAGRTDIRTVPPGMELHFMKSVAAIIPTRFTATNLREFLEIIRQISTESIYYHFVEARLRLGHVENDFSRWLRESLGENELANEVGRLDPYVYTLEGLRSTLIQLVERRLR